MISFGLPKKLTIAVVIIVALAIVLCVLVSKSIVRYAESHEHHHLKEIVETMLPSLDVEHIRHLTGSPDDVNTSHYISIKNSLIALRDVNPSYSFVYLMGVKDGEVVFLADAEEEDSEDFSPPGQMYPEASVKLQRIFQNGQSFVEGPITDEWGRWMSAHAAIVDVESGKVLAILGLDINASRWAKTTETYSHLSNIIVLLIILIATMLTFATLKAARDRANILSINSDLRDVREELLQKERLAVLGQLNAVVSHELRNPLGTISNATFLMKDALDSSDAVKGEKAI
jgi:signal transduction histidine kinase